MKRIAIVVMMALLPFVCLAGCSCRKKSVSRNELMGLVREYRDRNGFEVVRIGPLATGLLKSVAGAAMDECDGDEKKVMDLARGVKSMAIVDYEDADPGVRDRFNARAERILGRGELLMEVNDGDGRVRMYGVLGGDGDTVHDFVLFCPDEGALMCFFGSISMDAVAAIAAGEYDGQ